MRFMVNPTTEPRFNLTAEEYFLYGGSGTAALVWRNSPAVVIGLNQNAYAEVDLAAAEKRGVAVIRRLSGGGAVYHDEGCVCLSLITSGDFAELTVPVTLALRELGINARPSGRNDITAVVGGAEYKLSGMARRAVALENGEVRTLTHGTLLYDTDLNALGELLKPPPDKLAYKGVASVRKRVANVAELLRMANGAEPPARDEFFRLIADRLRGYFQASDGEAFTDAETAAINALAAAKYSSWEWNFGASKAYAAVKSARKPAGGVTVSFDADGGVITRARLEGDFFGGDARAVGDALMGCRLEIGALTAALSDADAVVEGYGARELAELILS